MSKPTGKLIRVTPEGIGAVATSSVVQSTGTSTTDVMSQKAVTDYSAKRTLYGEEVDGSAIVKTPSGNASLQVSYNGWLNILSKDGVATLSFSPSGVMQAGSIPIGRVTGYIKGVGIDQNWKSVSRQLGTSYTNTSGRPIMLSITLDTGGDDNKFYRTALRVTSSSGAVIVGFLGTYKPTADTGYDSVTTIIPPGASYSLNDYGSSTYINNSMLSWSELTQ
ncbi:hypothetical protein AB7160_00570 [Morganella morganii]|uniref:hypothetical protein n=1 Tax=Morganella morganii TaxID=582 RepID=UPI0034E5EF76